MFIKNHFFIIGVPILKDSHKLGVYYIAYNFAASIN